MRKQPERLKIIRSMSPLYHTLPGKPFRMEDSEVIRWLMRQPSVVMYIFDKARNYIRYDSETGTWMGVDYAD